MRPPQAKQEAQNEILCSRQPPDRAQQNDVKLFSLRRQIQTRFACDDGSVMTMQQKQFRVRFFRVRTWHSRQRWLSALKHVSAAWVLRASKTYLL